MAFCSFLKVKFALRNLPQVVGSHVWYDCIGGNAVLGNSASWDSVLNAIATNGTKP